MSIATKTKAEEAFEVALAKMAETLPGDDAASARRRDAIAAFGELGLPHRRIEEWKYTDLRARLRDAVAVSVSSDGAGVSLERVKQALGPLGTLDAYFVVVVDGKFRDELSDVAGATNVVASSFGSKLADGKVSEFGGTELANGVVALNVAFASDGAVLEVRDGTTLDQPIVVVHVRTGSVDGFVASRNVIRVGEKCNVTVVEAFVETDDVSGGGQVNAYCDVSVGAGSSLNHVKSVGAGPSTTHLGNCSLALERETSYNGFQFTFATQLVRNDVNVVFNGEDAALNLSGAFLARFDEHVDTTIVVDHKVPGCESRELFKGVLDGTARGVVQGKVIVRPDAQKTDGKQMAQALMLSPDTEFDSKPELEIYADDVACGHGSTVAELDKDLMFYCRSRGIPPAQARALLVQSFVGEALESIENEAIGEALMCHVRDWILAA